MNIKWKVLLPKLLFWLVIELFLNCIGIDDLADYGEFVFERNLMIESL
ncbi:conserved hypothetical protein [Gloeothece citriformis PCC 7424]|uniref:Uncharacterized protein n=1 Tax=Gloeothece citriformis (strain PCC 7424) TaxID=65393 RepID=B7KIK7_GLOC7|nr:hypothetical protein [Gloeothece citriformis]ACK69413.1 conserved hypothetical protein [Gloeothece citriformis PCC 7424]